MIVYVAWYTDNEKVIIEGVFAAKEKAEAALESVGWYDEQGVSEQKVDYGFV